MICCKLLELAEERMKGLKVEDLRVGLGYTAVKNSEGGIGLAYVLRDRLGNNCSHLDEAGEYIGKDLSETAKMFMDHNNVLKASIGLASINSVVQREQEDFVDGDIMDLLEIKKGDWVGMVGRFAPLIKMIKQRTPHLFVIEDKPQYHKNGQYKIFDEIMNKCDVMIITATTLINKTFEDILSKTPNARKRALLGPSAPMFREFYKGLGVDIVSGMIPQDTHKVIDIVSQGGGTRYFKKYSRKVNFLINRK